MLSKKRKGFTLVECMVCMLIISVVGINSIYLVNGYMKNTYTRDVQTKAVIQNINTIERMKAEVNTLPELYDFLQEMDSETIKLIAVGVGEVQLNKDGNGNVIINRTGKDESFGFNPLLQPVRNNLFRVEISGSINGEILQNTKLITIMRINS